MLNMLVLTIRVPLGLVANAMATVVYTALLVPLSAFILPPSFVYLALTRTPQEIQQHRLASWPFFHEYRSRTAAIWAWATATPYAAPYEPLQLWVET